MLNAQSEKIKAESSMLKAQSEKKDLADMSVKQEADEMQ
jgi:hypothetical protein